MNHKIILFLMPSLKSFRSIILIARKVFIYSIFFKNYFIIQRQLKTFILLIFLYLFVQVFSDLYRATPSEDYLRGWSNIIFFLIHTSTLFVLLSNDKNNFFIFGLGYVLGIILTTFYSPNIYFQGGSFWKFGYGTPIRCL